MHRRNRPRPYTSTFPDAPSEKRTRERESNLDRSACGGCEPFLLVVGIVLGVGLLFFGYEFAWWKLGMPGPVVSLEDALASGGPRVFLDISIEGVDVGRIEAQLFEARAFVFILVFASHVRFSPFGFARRGAARAREVGVCSPPPIPTTTHSE